MMMNPGLPTSLWAQLEGRLWHATGKEGLTGIVKDEQIRVSTADRYQNSFCRLPRLRQSFRFRPGIR